MELEKQQIIQDFFNPCFSRFYSFLVIPSDNNLMESSELAELQYLRADRAARERREGNNE